MQYQAVKYFNYFSKNEDYNGFQQEKPIIVSIQANMMSICLSFVKSNNA